MASVIRIKRRRTDDPAEALLLSHKKSRTAEEPDNILDVESVLEFAGTLDSKEDSISKHIKEAIRKKKIHKQMHPHSSDFKLPHDRDNVTDRIRKQKAESSHNERYRITCSRRALNIDNLDSGKVEDDKEKVSHCAHDKLQSSRLLSDEERKGNSKTSPESGDAPASLHTTTILSASGDKKSTVDKENTNVKSPSAICEGICGNDRKQKEDEKVFCLIDVEHEKQPESSGQTTASEITMNGIPMKSVKAASAKVPVMEESDDYVYDLYYTHTRLGHIKDEAVLTVEALCNEFLHDERADEGDDFVYDDDDDSNDEGNWRNDYPDEDPHFFENAERDYDFQNNMKESNFDGDNDDEGDLLSYWMDTRCKIDVDCNDFEDNYEKDGSSSDEEAGAEMGYY